MVMSVFLFERFASLEGSSVRGRERKREREREQQEGTRRARRRSRSFFAAFKFQSVCPSSLEETSP